MSAGVSLDLPDGVMTGRRVDPQVRSIGKPLIVALHGGGYSSAFFDIAGYSLLDRAAAAGCAAVALNRPGYGGTPLLGPTDSILRANARRLDAAVAKLWREVFEINTRWPGYAREVCGRVRVPVHYRQGEQDPVWAQGTDQLDAFRRAFTHAPSVDARLVPDTAHAIDFHNAGPAFQDEQVGFAIACAKG